jgi:hypothetical protein
VDAGHAATALKPLYDDSTVAPAYQLRYDWTAWSSEGAEPWHGWQDTVGVLATACETETRQLLAPGFLRGLHGCLPDKRLRPC